MKNTKRFAGGVSLALALGLSGALLQPATFASAATVDCRYTKGMGEYVYDHPELGLSCAGGTGGIGGTVSPAWGAPGRAHPSVGAASGTSAPCATMPDALYSQGPITYEESRVDDDRLGETITRKYYRSGKLVAATAATREKIYYLDYTFSHLGFNISSLFWCQGTGGTITGSWSTYLEDVPKPSDAAPTPPAIPTPGVVSLRTSLSINTTTSMAQIPAKTNEYVFRAKITNTGTYSTPVNFGLDLESFKLTGDLGLPRDTSCLTTATLWAECTIPNLAAGETQNITLLMKTRPTWHTTATLPTMTSGNGSVIGFTDVYGRGAGISRTLPVTKRQSVEVEVTPSFPKP